MPKYRNSTHSDIVVGSIRFPALSDVEIKNFIEGTLPAGLTLISLDPIFNRVLLNEKYSKVATNEFAISVPENNETGEYVFSIYVSSGEFQLECDIIPYSFTLAETIAQGQTWGRKFSCRGINVIVLKCIADGIAYVKIFKC